jgi:hypothetical protein
MKNKVRWVSLGAVILLCLLAMLGCGGAGSTSPISMFTVSTTTPGYNGVVQLTPTLVWQPTSAMIGTSGAGSSDVTANAVSGTAYNSAKLTSAATFTLTVVYQGKTYVQSVTATPTPLVFTAISPATTTLAPPANVTFTPTISGGATNSVTWTATGGSITSGGVWTAPNTAGTYTITGTSVDKPTVSNTATVKVSIPVITSQPSSLSICPGNTGILSVGAQYAATYEWYLNNVLIPGAISPTYTIPAATTSQAGTYFVTITNPAGSVSSNPVNVAIGSTITGNPSNVTLYQTQVGVFRVSASGNSPFSYQWYQQPPGGSFSAISGATKSVYQTAPEYVASNGTQFYATVTDSCSAVNTSSTATMTVVAGNAPPTIVTQPAGQIAAVGSTPTFTVVASGTGTLSYQWYRIPAGSVVGTAITGATSASYQVPATATTTSNDQDQYFVVVTNSYGQATSSNATLAVGNGILITGQPTTAYVNPGNPATFTVTASSALSLSYQWYVASPGSAVFSAISGATSASYTISSAATSQSGAVYKVVISNGGSTSNVTSNSVALFVGALNQIGSLCSTSWITVGNATSPASCTYQLVDAVSAQHGNLVWPLLISPGNIQLSFAISNYVPAATTPGDGWTMVLGDPSLGATTSSLGATGYGMGAAGIPGFVLAFDTYENSCSTPGFGCDFATVPYLGVGRGETALWETPWLNGNTTIPALWSLGTTVSHNYNVSIDQGQMVVSMDGTQVFSGAVNVPPVAYLMFTASTGSATEQVRVTSLSATVSVP